jgi:hypothetical protein
MGETRKAIFSSSQRGLARLIDEATPLTVETPGGGSRFSGTTRPGRRPTGNWLSLRNF